MRWHGCQTHPQFDQEDRLAKRLGNSTHGFVSSSVRLTRASLVAGPERMALFSRIWTA